MAKEKQIGIIYNFDENWIGGAYYIQNVISSLNYLPDNKQIELQILTKNNEVFQELQQRTGYKYLKFKEYPLTQTPFENNVRRVFYKLFKKKLVFKKVKIDWVFPVFTIPENLKHIKNLVFWIPDLQQKYLPDFFDETELKLREDSCCRIIELNRPIIFSSKAALADFNTFYPNSKNLKKVIPFAVVNPILPAGTIHSVKEKYKIEGDYFFSPNQFWQHKNHIAIIEAVKILGERGAKVKIVFTGKEYDYRNPEYTTFLKQKVVEYGLQNQVLFLGFIDRIDQLVLMKNASAVIQPSLFEGWSTVVEDAKAQNQTLIVSDIPVHKEQLEDKAYYFSPNNYNELASKIVEVLENPSDKLRYDLDYSENIKKFAQNIQALVEQ